MIRLVAAEITKLRGSFALLFALIVPALMPVIAFLLLALRARDARWEQVVAQLMLPLWVLFLMPMAMAVFCALAAQIEYRAKAWDQVLTLPYSRLRIFAAKLFVLLVAMAAMNVLLLVYVFGLFGAANALFRPFLTGDPHIADTVGAMAGVLVASAFMFAVQAWASLRFGNFLIPLAVGIGGTLVALGTAMMRSSDADWFPWVMPMRSLSPEDAGNVVLYGAVGGAVTIVLALIDLSRRQLR